MADIDGRRSAAPLIVSSTASVPAASTRTGTASPGKRRVEKPQSRTHSQASSATAGYPVSAVNDGNQDTYWESAGNGFPQWARVDLGAATSVDQIVLKVPEAGMEKQLVLL